MEDIYTRTEMLIGHDAVQKLKNSSVAVFGLGGVGSYIAESLARCGVGKMTVIDGDAVSPSNLNRQLIATVRTVGRRKAEVTRERLLSINPEAEVTAVDMFFSAETCDKIDFTQFDYVADAIDTVTSKLLIIEMARAAGVPVISSMGTGNKLDPTALRVSDIYKTEGCPLARVMRRELRARGVDKLDVVWSPETPRKPYEQTGADGEDNPNNADTAFTRRATPASISFVPGAAGLAAAAHIVAGLTGNDNL